MNIMHKLETAKKKGESVTRLKNCHQNARNAILRLRYEGMENEFPDILELQKDLNAQIDAYFHDKIQKVERSIESMFV